MNNADKIMWLRSRGGRTESDLLSDNKGEFVLMTDGHGKDVKVYLPKKFKWINHRPVKICKKEI